MVVHLLLLKCSMIIQIIQFWHVLTNSLYLCDKIYLNWGIAVKKIVSPIIQNSFAEYIIFSTQVNLFKTCPHQLSGTTIRAAILGTNPFIYTDVNRKIIYGNDGLPLGANTGILRSLSKVFGFTLQLTVFTVYDFFDEKLKKWIGMSGEVSLASVQNWPYLPTVPCTSWVLL